MMALEDLQGYQWRKDRACGSLVLDNIDVLRPLLEAGSASQGARETCGLGQVYLPQSQSQNGNAFITTPSRDVAFRLVEEK